MALTLVKQKTVNPMSLVIAIKCSDRIIVATDGRSVDTDTREVYDTVKLFGITENSTVMVAGEGIIDAMEKYMDDLVHSVRDLKLNNISDIAAKVNEILEIRNWAEWKDDKQKSHLVALISGYEGNEPRIYARFSDGELATGKPAYAFGGWNARQQYLVENIYADSSKNSAKLGTKTSIEMLVKAQKANPEEIGEPFAVWHIMPNRIRKLDTTEIAKLTNRYG